MEFVREVSSKAKKANRRTESEEILNVDDILVEMALLNTRKQENDPVFYFTIYHKNRRWKIRRTWDHFVQIHGALSKKDRTFPRLPKFSISDKKLYLRLTLFLRFALNHLDKNTKEWDQFLFFIEGAYSEMDSNKMG